MKHTVIPSFVIATIALNACNGSGSVPSSQTNGTGSSASVLASATSDVTRSSAGAGSSDFAKSSFPVVYVLNSGGSEATISVFSGKNAAYVRSLHLGTYETQRESIAADDRGHFYASPTTNGKQTLNAYESKGARVWNSIQQKNRFSYVTLDAQNNIYTACSNSKICEYTALDNNGHQKLLWSIGLKQIGAQVGHIAVDSAGDLALSNANAVWVFSHRAQNPSITINTTGSYAGAVAFDSSNNLYVAMTKGVGVYPPGGTMPTRTITEGFAAAAALAFDALGNLYVANACGTQCGSTPASVCVFASGSEHPERIIKDGMTENFSGMAVSGSGYVYAANSGGSDGAGSVIVYAPGSVKPHKTITSNVDSPTAIVVAS